jgi:RNA polymerase sigma factor (sigma-70 family)
LGSVHTGPTKGSKASLEAAKGVNLPRQFLAAKILVTFCRRPAFITRMADATDFELLREYKRTGSEDAFRSVVERHLNLVYSVAQSRLANEAMAKDITQVVFAVLATKAGQLSDKVVLSGWLFQVTTHACHDLRRAEARRKKWESEAVQDQLTQSEPDNRPEPGEIAPVISRALGSLAAAERDAILLRFFEGNEFREVGLRLGVSEAAAKMRVSRGLEKLRHLLQKRGVTVSNATLCNVLPQKVHPAPAGLGAAVKTVSALHTALSPSNTALLKGVLKAMAWTKAKTAIISAVVVASLVTPLVLQQQAQTLLRRQDEVWRQQAGQLAKLKTENERLAGLAANSSLSREQSNDLQRLRAEIGPLQQQSNDVARLRQENRRLQASLKKPMTPVQIKEQMIARAGYSRDLIIASFQYATNNQGQFPTSLDQAAAFLPEKARAQTRLTTDDLEIVYRGSPDSLPNPTNTIVIREKQAWQSNPAANPKGNWMKYYAFGDGSVRLHQEPDNNFEEYEKQHMISSGNP